MNTTTQFLLSEAARGGTAALRRYGIKGATANALTRVAGGPRERKDPLHEAAGRIRRFAIPHPTLTVAFVLYTDSVALTRLQGATARTGRTVQITRHTAPSATTLIEELDAGPPAQAVHLVGLERWPAGFAEACAALDAARNALAEVHRPVLVWLQERDAPRLTRSAPHLWHRRAAIIETQ